MDRGIVAARDSYEKGKYEQAAFRLLMGIFGCIMVARDYRNALRDCNVSVAVDETPSGGGGRGCVGDESNYGESMNISDQRMYQQGQHFNRHGRGMGYSNKKEYEQAARDFFEQNRNTAEIYEGIWNSSRGGQTQIIVRQDGIQLIVNKETGQIIDYYEGTSLSGFINIERVQCYETYLRRNRTRTTNR